MIKHIINRLTLLSLKSDASAITSTRIVTHADRYDAYTHYHIVINNNICMHRSIHTLDRAAAIVRANAVLMSAAFAISTDTRNQHTRKHDCAVTYKNVGERQRASRSMDVDDSNMASNLLTPSSAYRSSDTLSNDVRISKPTRTRSRTKHWLAHH